MIDLALIGRDEETKWIPGQSRMWLDDTCPHEASGRSGLRQLYDKMALAGRVRGNEIGRAHGTPVTNAQLVCRLLLEKKKNINNTRKTIRAADILHNCCHYQIIPAKPISIQMMRK